MNSCLYECDVFHSRLSPKKYSFRQRLFTFYLDLDEIDELEEKNIFFGHNGFNLFNFKDSDYMPGSGKSAKENILKYLGSIKFPKLPQKIMLMTHVRLLGYVFNPVSYYFCFDADMEPVCLVALVGNTFGEQKPFLLDSSKIQNAFFKDRQTKYYYISPFIDLDAQLDFNIQIPGEQFFIGVDDFKDGQKFFISTMTGRRKELSSTRLLWYALRYPFVTLQVIFMIHWHAWRLWCLGVGHHPKEENLDLQRGLVRGQKKK